MGAHLASLRPGTGDPVPGAQRPGLLARALGPGGAPVPGRRLPGIRLAAPYSQWQPLWKGYVKGKGDSEEEAN